jgi:hypothetical protein
MADTIAATPTENESTFMGALLTQLQTYGRRKSGLLRKSQTPERVVPRKKPVICYSLS